MATMDVTTAKEMVARYAATRKSLIDETYGINDTVGIWFSLDQINNFLANLADGTTGVRLYLGVYGDDQASLYPGQTTLIAIGTVSDGTGRDVDGLSATPPAPKDGGDPNDPFNHGKLCPPDTGCA